MELATWRRRLVLSDFLLERAVYRFLIIDDRSELIQTVNINSTDDFQPWLFQGLKWLPSKQTSHSDLIPGGGVRLFSLFRWWLELGLLGCLGFLRVAALALTAPYISFLSISLFFVVLLLFCCFYRIVNCLPSVWNPKPNTARIW